MALLSQQGFPHCPGNSRQSQFTGAGPARLLSFNPPHLGTWILS